MYITHYETLQDRQDEMSRQNSQHVFTYKVYYMCMYWGHSDAVHISVYFVIYVNGLYCENLLGERQHNLKMLVQYRTCSYKDIGV
jgi:hypothetical protein